MDTVFFVPQTDRAPRLARGHLSRRAVLEYHRRPPRYRADARAGAPGSRDFDRTRTTRAGPRGRTAPRAGRWAAILGLIAAPSAADLRSGRARPLEALPRAPKNRSHLHNPPQKLGQPPPAVPPRPPLPCGARCSPARPPPAA